ncbi:MAG: glycine zipper 2TM domain-containing protein [Hyphomicrobiaceae bacterium]|nr:glycine zipper 2TM domain-containing protein [Hyphomicrobiaceae bacterium]
MNAKMQLTAIAVMLGLTACGDSGPKQNVGTVAGAIAGGVIGSQIGGGDGRLVATGVGAALGALVGSEIGRQLDERDQLLMAEAQTGTLTYDPPGTVRPWRNPSNGHHGEVSAGPPYSVNYLKCREFTHTVFIDGRREILRDQACQQPDGTWRPS